jgi:hypothetical protein
MQLSWLSHNTCSTTAAPPRVARTGRQAHIPPHPTPPPRAASRSSRTDGAQPAQPASSSPSPKLSSGCQWRASSAGHARASARHAHCAAWLHRGCAPQVGGAQAGAPRDLQRLQPRQLRPAGVEVAQELLGRHPAHRQPLQARQPHAAQLRSQRPKVLGVREVAVQHLQAAQLRPGRGAARIGAQRPALVQRQAAQGGRQRGAGRRRRAGSEPTGRR